MSFFKSPVHDVWVKFLRVLYGDQELDHLSVHGDHGVCGLVHERQCSGGRF